MTNTQRKQAIKFCRAHAADHMDPVTNEVNLTNLAESAASELGQDQWLDDYDHEIWDIAYIEGLENFDSELHA